MAKKMCPMKFNNSIISERFNNHAFECLEEKCAWWVEGRKWSNENQKYELSFCGILRELRRA